MEGRASGFHRLTGAGRLKALRDRCSAALLGRLGHHVHVLITKRRSYRTNRATDHLTPQKPDTP